MTPPWADALLYELYEMVRQSREQDFVAANNAPFLLYAPATPASRDMLDTYNSGAMAKRMSWSAKTKATTMRIAVVQKTARNPFVGKVYLGRATNNDIVLEEASVSKTHACFEQSDRGQWLVSDIGSSNGTKLEAVRLATHVAVPVADGNRLEFGGVAATWYSPAAFHRFVLGQLAAETVRPSTDRN